jgi:hypothetical protein
MLTGQAYAHLGLPGPTTKPQQPLLFGDDET